MDDHTCVLIMCMIISIVTINHLLCYNFNLQQVIYAEYNVEQLMNFIGAHMQKKVVLTTT